MKKIYLLLLIVSFIQCKKNDPTPPATTNPTPAPTNGMTATEASLVGKWYWDKTEKYQGGVLQSTILNTDPYYGGTVYMDLKSSWYNNVKKTLYIPQAYDMIVSFNGGTAGSWMVYPPTAGVSSLPMLDGIYNYMAFYGFAIYIQSVTSTELILLGWGGNIPEGDKMYFHK